jgi:hypothetical protein
MPGTRRTSSVLMLLAFVASAALTLSAQTTPANGSPIAIVSIDSSDPGKAANVTGALQIYGGRAFIAASGTITSGNQTTRVILPHRGEMRVCAMSSIKLAADSNSAAGETPGLLMAMEEGAVEMSYAATADIKNADTLLTPDFRILIGGPGAADLKVRLGTQGDTCVDNAGADGPYVVVSSVFEGGTYRVQPGQRVMFQHGSLHQVVDQEKETCGCPPAAAEGNEFPLAQSMGLSGTPKATPPPPVNPQAQKQAQDVPPLVHNGNDNAPVAEILSKPVAPPAPAATSQVQPQPKKKSGFFSKVGHMFRRIFGAES